MKDLFNIALVSTGSGAAFDYTINAARMGIIDVNFAKLIVDRNCDAIKIAEKWGIPCVNINPERKKLSKEEISYKILHEVKNIDLICLSFSRLIGEPLLSSFKHRIINSHPAILPAYKGFGAIEKVRKEGTSLFTGGTVHFVDEGIDTGPTIIQSIVPIMQDDTDYSLTLKIWNFQKKNLAQVFQWFSQDRIKIIDNKCFVEMAQYGFIPTNPRIEIDLP